MAERRATCRYCGDEIILGKRGWRLDINSVAGYHCEDAPRGQHNPRKDAEGDGHP